MVLQRKKTIIEIKSEAFAGRIIKLNSFLRKEKNEQVISKQLYRCGTSIGANVAESRYAQSEPDFVSKLSIALKEANETCYWINCLHNADLKILISSIKTKKENMLNKNLNINK